MPRVRQPSLAEIKSDPRAFTILQLLSPESDGTVSDAALTALTSKYEGAKTTKPDLTFEEFAALFQKPSTTNCGSEGNCIGFAAADSKASLKPWRFNRRPTGARDVRIQLAYCGVCHSDIHTARGEWAGVKYPCVPGHEMVGIVTEVGADVTKFKVGSRVGVGCVVGSCRNCAACKDDEEQHCPKCIYTYNGNDWDGGNTYGGYSTFIVIREDFVLNIPDNLKMSEAAPLLCAGITTYSPIRYYGLDKPGLKVGVVGLGGLGHMAIKFLKALGVESTVISTSPGKRDEAIKVLGADNFVVSKDADQMKAAANSLDGIIDTVSATHDLEAPMSLLKFKGKYIMLGVATPPPSVPVGGILFQKKLLAGSLVGGIKETQEMLDFCAEKQIYCMAEHININYVNEAYDRVVKGDVRYRFIIDLLDCLVN